MDDAARLDPAPAFGTAFGCPAASGAVLACARAKLESSGSDAHFQGASNESDTQSDPRRHPSPRGPRHRRRDVHRAREARHGPQRLALERPGARRERGSRPAGAPRLLPRRRERRHHGLLPGDRGGLRRPGLLLLRRPPIHPPERRARRRGARSHPRREQVPRARGPSRRRRGRALRSLSRGRQRIHRPVHAQPRRVRALSPHAHRRAPRGRRGRARRRDAAAL